MLRKIFFGCALTFFGLAAAGAYASLTSGGPRMGPQSTTTRPAFHGYYDGHKVTYLNTDVSVKADATMMHINYAPGLKAVPLSSAPEIYLVEGKATAGQLAVFGSEPGEKDYSPVWKETILTWKASANPVLIRSDTQVNQLGKKGGLREGSRSFKV